MFLLKQYRAKVVFYRPPTWTVGLQRSLVWHYSRDELNLPRELGLSLSKPVCSPVDRAVLRRLMFIVPLSTLFKSPAYAREVSQKHCQLAKCSQILSFHHFISCQFSVKYILKSLTHGIKDRFIFEISFQETNSLFSCVGQYRLALSDFTHS